MSDTTDKLRIEIKRAYDTPAWSDGSRILVDRIWPRDMSKEELRLDDWVKEVAPSTQLRKWFGHDPSKWNVFKDRYFRELEERPGVVKALLAGERAGTLTLVFGAKDTDYNNAAALKEYLVRPTEK